jgi:hypothetical protein
MVVTPPKKSVRGASPGGTMNRNGSTKRLEWISSVTVIITLVVLVFEVRANTRAVERQILQDRNANVAAPFLSGPELLQAIERVKTVDGWPEVEQRFMERYEMTPVQAAVWSRHLMAIWMGLEADFASNGPSDAMAASVWSLLQYPDNQVFWAHSTFSGAFTAYVRSVAPTSQPGGG